MATTTDNYGLIKPLTTDYYDIEIQNGNMDAIDQALKENVDGIASEAVARAEANDTLQDNLDAEITARVAVDTALQAVATQAANGMMSAADKAKLDGVAAGANNYVHPTTAGNKHIPAGGAADQILGYTADGTPTWIQQMANKSLLSAATSARYGVANVDAALTSIPLKKTIVTLTSSGSWTPPKAPLMADIFMISGGGGGGGGYGSGAGAGGGGGGIVKLIKDYRITSTSPIPFVIGAGGAAGAVGANGGNGGSTSFGNFSTNGAGEGGRSGSNSYGEGGAGGAGGGAGGGRASVEQNPGGKGADGYGGNGETMTAKGGNGRVDSSFGGYCYLNNTLYGGGGGGGNNTDGYVGGAGGDGGGGAGGTNSAGAPGSMPGAGGGGGGRSSANVGYIGGAGAAGIIIIAY